MQPTEAWSVQMSKLECLRQQLRVQVGGGGLLWHLLPQKRCWVHLAGLRACACSLFSSSSLPSLLPSLSVSPSLSLQKL